MKISVSLPDADVAFLDEYAASHGEQSRSAVVAYTVKLLREHELADQYELAWDEWFGSEDAALWDRTSGDGIAPDPEWDGAPLDGPGNRASR